METELDTDTDTDTDDDDVDIDNIYEEVLNDKSFRNNQDHIRLSTKSSHSFSEQLQNNQHQVRTIYQNTLNNILLLMSTFRHATKT